MFNVLKYLRKITFDSIYKIHENYLYSFVNHLEMESTYAVRFSDLIFSLLITLKEIQ